MHKSKNNKGILIALALGDGYLATQKNSHRLYIEHAAKQFTWIDYKKKLIENIFGCKPLSLHKRIRTDKRTGKTLTSYIVVKCHPYFRILKRFMYTNNGKKEYRKEVLNWLNPQGLAIWYQDDGFLNHKIVSLSTYCNEQEANSIIEFFKEKYNLEIRKYYHKGNKAFYHAFDIPNSNKFLDIVYPYIIPEMLYKVPGSYFPRVLDNI